jgi:hypothetical protein
LASPASRRPRCSRRRPARSRCTSRGELLDVRLRGAEPGDAIHDQRRVGTFLPVSTYLLAGITGRDNQWAHVFAKPAPTLPHEPFLWLTTRGLLVLFGTIDRITDRQIRAR